MAADGQTPGRGLKAIKIAAALAGTAMAGDVLLRFVESALGRSRLYQRLQTATVLAIVLAQTSLAGLTALFLAMFSKYTRVAAAVYMLWAYLDKAGWRNSYKSMFFRKLPIWRWFRDYFPAQLIKTAELPPDHKYLFAYHPHGILSLGVIANFGTEANNFHTVFPGVDLRVGVVNAPFYFPFAREICLFLGCISADKSSVDYSLNDGKSVMLVVGGANEALQTESQRMKLVLADRKGFVKCALAHGASLVPVVTFGENDTYTNVKADWAQRNQVWMMKKMGFSLPLAYGRGVFNYNVGILPHRAPLVSVVGAPIHLSRVSEDDPSFNARVDDIHQQYMAQLADLHAAHKGKYAQAGEAESITFIRGSKL